MGAIPVTERFSRLAWGQKLQGDAAYPQVRALGMDTLCCFAWARGYARGAFSIAPALVCSTLGRVPESQRKIGSFLPPCAYLQMGLLAGGLADGSVCVWDPAAMLAGKGEGRQPFLAKMQKHTGAVRGEDAVQLHCLSSQRVP